MTRISAHTHARRLHAVRSFLEAEAAAGRPCPSNNAMMLRADLSCIAESNRLLVELEMLGAVKVQRKGNSRRVTVAATGHSTGWTVKERRQRPTSKDAGGTVPDKAPDRRPCGYCAIRADIGCRHQRGAPRPQAPTNRRPARPILDGAVSAYARAVSAVGASS